MQRDKIKIHYSGTFSLVSFIAIILYIIFLQVSSEKMLILKKEI